MIEIIIFLISLVAVIVGANWLGALAAQFAKKASVPKILIGASLVTVASVGPEIIIAIACAIIGKPRIGIGVVFGASLIDIGLILGLLLFFSKVLIDEPHYTRTIQIFLATLVLVFLVSVTGRIPAISGLILIFFGLLYIAIEVFITKHEETFIDNIGARFWRLKKLLAQKISFWQAFYLIGGLFLVVFGSYFLITSAATISVILAIPEILIGLLMIAVAVSIPEIITAVNSIARRRTEISAGSLFSASIANLTFALGFLSIFGGAKIGQPESYLLIASMALLAMLGLLPVFGRIPQRLLGTLSIIIYFLSLFLIGKTGI
jgi:cation:H+ antiporter